MQQHRIATVLVVVVMAFSLACLIQPSEAQGSPFGSSRPASVIFEPTLSFFRQNMKLVNSYVALFRSIFVGAYERPLVTSTDAPTSSIRVPSVRVPPMDLPEPAKTPRRN